MAKTKVKTKALSRHDLPVSQPGATEFSDDRDVLSPLQVVRLLKQRPEILNELVEATTIVHEGRKKRLDGLWALAFLAFTCSTFVDVEPWWVASIDTTVWDECGFDGRPSFNTVYDRFIELETEGFEAAFRQAAYRLIRRAPASTAADSSGGTSTSTAPKQRRTHVYVTSAEWTARVR